MDLKKSVNHYRTEMNISWKNYKKTAVINVGTPIVIIFPLIRIQMLVASLSAEIIPVQK